MREITENGICMACRETESGIEILRAQTQLQRVEVPAALFGRPVTALGARVFAADSEREAHRRIRTVSLPDTLEQVGDYAFYSCTGLVDAVIPQNVEEIGNYAFYGCQNLTEVVLSEKIVSVGNYAFANCEKLQSIDLPTGLISIGYHYY